MVASLLVTSLLSPLLIDHHGWRHLQVRLFLSDILQLAIFAWAALTARRPSFYAIVLLQALTVAVHVAVGLNVEPGWAPAYATSLLVFSWLILFTLTTAGLWRAFHRRTVLLGRP